MKGGEAGAAFCFSRPRPRGRRKAAKATRAPAAETGRSCWGRGQQDASDSEADAGCRNPGSGIAQAMTERASPSPESRRTAISCLFGRAKLCPNFSIHAGNRAIRAGFIDFFPQMRYIQSNLIFYGFTISFHHSKEVFVCRLIVSLRCVFWVAPSIRGGGYRFAPSGLSAGSSVCPDCRNAHHPCRPGFC